MAGIWTLMVLFGVLGRGHTELKRCRTSYMSKDQCPDWHYCETSNGRCRPCYVCQPEIYGGEIDNCRPPVACTYGDENIVCPPLYPLFRDTNLTQDRYSYLGTGASATCRPSANDTVISTSLKCRARRVQVTTEYGTFPMYNSSWEGDMSCVTLVNPAEPTTLPPLVIAQTYKVTLIVTLCVVAMGVCAACLVGCRYFKMNSSQKKNVAVENIDESGTLGEPVDSDHPSLSPTEDISLLSTVINMQDSQTSFSVSNQESAHLSLHISTSDIVTPSPDDTLPKHQLLESSRDDTEATTPSPVSESTTSGSNGNPETLLTTDPEYTDGGLSCIISDHTEHYLFSNHERLPNQNSCEDSSAEYPKNQCDSEMYSQTGQKVVDIRKVPTEHFTSFDSNQLSHDTSNILSDPNISPDRAEHNIYLTSVDYYSHSSQEWDDAPQRGGVYTVPDPVPGEIMDMHSDIALTTAFDIHPYTSESTTSSGWVGGSWEYSSPESAQTGSKHLPGSSDSGM